MDNKLAKLIELVKQLPEYVLDDAITYVEAKINEYTNEKPNPPCPHCKTDKVKRFGRTSNRQRYRCNECKKTFMETTNTIMEHSQCGEAAWKQVIRDTVDGVPLEKTSESLHMSHSTAFNMRHKILLALEAEEKRKPTVFDGICELDDTFVLESYKGSKLPEDFWRKPRKHGAVAQKRGLSNEYLCISTGVQREGASYSRTVTRGNPGKDDINSVYEGRISKESLIICDGAKGYASLGESCGCPVVNVDEDKGFAHVNTANSFHSFIKDRYVKYKGVSTKYLNRYNTLFSNTFRNSASLIDKIYELLCANDIPRHHSIKDVRSLNLLNI